MSWMNDAQLARMRSDVAMLLPDNAIIYGVSMVSDSAGGFTNTWAAVTGGTVACRLDPLGSRSAETLATGDQERLKVAFQLTVPYDAPIAVDRRVVVGGDTYEILQMSDDHSWRVSRRAIVGRVD